MCIRDRLKVNKSLAELNLYDNKVGNEGALVISEALKVNKTLTHLRFVEMGIRIEGAKLIAEALKFNKTLVNVRIDSYIMNNFDSRDEQNEISKKDKRIQFFS
eukprot:TRINITY_DN21405_c0_g1_i1.p2 TRINITY_DN21405_c0_g1~~TRINITY_DN21405_c0_g1_i1.p2  ORF type:complete len:103 (-),score=27.59 TRINITY_DN21405_c0_g1_i1:70-378(-)